MVVVNLTRSRAESLGNVALGLGLLAPGGRLVVAGAQGRRRRRRWRRRSPAALPVEGSFVKAHGRVIWLDRPERLPEAAEEWARAAAPAANAEGFVTAPGMFSPEHADPGSRLAGRGARRAARRGGSPISAPAGAGSRGRRSSATRGSPRSTCTRPSSIALDAARTNVPDPRARFHWSDVTRLGDGGGPCDAVIMNPPFHQGRAAEPDLGVGLHRGGGADAEAAGAADAGGEPADALRGGARRGASGAGRSSARQAGYKLLEAEGPRRG